MKPSVPVVIAPQKAEALGKLIDIAAERESPLTAVSAQWRYHGERQNNSQTLIIDQSPARDFIPDHAQFPLALDGAHQLQNGVVALAALQAVREQFPALDKTAVQSGLNNVVWNGRLQTIHHAPNSPTFLVDCAHNPDSITRLCDALQQNYTYQRLILIFGAPSDKAVPNMLAQIVPLADLTITAAANHPRATDPAQLAKTVHDLGGIAIIASSAADALTTAWENATPTDLICATGSIIFVGDLLNQWDSLKSRLLSEINHN
jgi:dihydrofolate synthase/folylpolyglutamate synthase